MICRNSGMENRKRYEVSRSQGEKKKETKIAALSRASEN